MPAVSVLVTSFIQTVLIPERLDQPGSVATPSPDAGFTMREWLAAGRFCAPCRAHRTRSARPHSARNLDLIGGLVTSPAGGRLMSPSAELVPPRLAA